MSIISIRLPEQLLTELNQHAKELHVPRTEYIREAIQAMNDKVAKKICKERIQSASLKVRKESMKINKEFSEIEHDPED